jgi:penicillin-binding protein 1A
MAFFGLIGRRKRKRRGERVEPRLTGGKAGGRSRDTARSPRRPSRRDPPRRPARRRRVSILRVVTWGATLCLWAGIVAVGATSYVYLNLDERGLFQMPEREPGMMLLSADGHVVAERGSFFGDEVRIDELPRYVPEAVIAIEDRRFDQHFGIDPVGLVRAFLANYQAGRVVQGGSTITQQLAKNLFLEPERTYERKFQEAVLALWLENRYSKDEILQLYLNRTYFGAGATGVEKASQKFFGKSARDITLAEAAILAAVLNAPSALNPINHPDRAAARAKLVIAEMVETGAITKAEAEQAQSAPTAIKPADYIPATQYIVDWVTEQLPDLIGTLDESVVVETTIDRRLQAQAESVVRKRLDEEGEALGVSQAAMVVLDTDGAVKALVGGRSYIKSQFNRAVKAKRQPGSSFKPFVYLTALEQGATPDSIVVDEPVTIDGWSPENYRREYRGAVTLRTALALSINTVAAKLGNSVGPINVVSTARRLGIRSDMHTNASIALGTSEVTLLELTAAFTPFANGGRSVVPHVVTRIATRDGRVLYERRGSGLGQAVMHYDISAMNDMLRAVVTSGTGRRAALAGRDIAGKTGTSQDYRDAWFIGYSAQLVAGVWAGNDDNSPTKRVTGGSLPAGIGKDVMEPAHAGLDPMALPGDLGPQIASDWPWAEVDDTRSYQPYQYDNSGIFGLFQGLFGGSRAASAQPPEYRDTAPEPQPGRRQNMDHLISR